MIGLHHTYGKMVMQRIGTKTLLRLRLAVFFENIMQNWYQPAYQFIESLELSPADETEEKFKLFQQVFTKELTIEYLQPIFNLHVIQYLLTASTSTHNQPYILHTTFRSTSCYAHNSPLSKLILFTFHTHLFDLQHNVFTIVKHDEEPDIRKKAWLATADFFSKCNSKEAFFSLHEIYEAMLHDEVYKPQKGFVDTINAPLENNVLFKKSLKLIEKHREIKSNAHPTTQIQRLIEKKNKKGKTVKSQKKSSSDISEKKAKQKGILRSILEEFGLILWGSFSKLVVSPPPSEEQK